MSDLAAFLAGFRPDGHVTYVAIVPDGRTEARTINGDDPSAAARWIEAHNRHAGVYFTVNPTPPDLDRKPTKALITAVAGVWSDVDPLDSGDREWADERTRLLALADELAGRNCPPSFIVDSGNGIQPVWLLEQPIEASAEYRDAAEALCSRIEHALGASGTHNLDRLLRVPGTINYPNKVKRRKGRGETQARLLHAIWRHYTWRDLEAVAQDLERDPPRYAVPVTRHRQDTGAEHGDNGPADPAAEISDELRDRLNEAMAEDVALWEAWNGQAPAGSDQTRSAFDLRLAGALRANGNFSLDDFATLARHWPHGKGPDGDPRHWRRTWDKAEPAEEHATATGPWPEPEPLPSGPPAVDPFPFELLPGALRSWVEDAAERTQAPPDYIAVAVIVALGSLLGRQIAIHPKRHDDWTVVPNLWGAIIGPPGVLKTPALEEALRHLRAMEVDAKRFFDEETKIWETRNEVDRERKKLRSETIKKRLKEHQDPDAIARDLAAEDDGEVPEPTRRRFIANDATIEKIGELLHENPTGLLLYRDELMAWLRGLESEGSETSRAFYLEAWNGTGRFTCDRIGRGTIDIEAACISVLGGIQPGPLLAYLASRAWEGGGADGLLQRFQMAVWPDISRTWRNVDRWPNAAARDQARAIFARFRDIANEIPPTTDGSLPAVRFTPEAQDAFDAWRAKLEQRLRAGDLHPALEAHLAKYRSLLPALALICHLADHDEVSPVGKLAFDRAEAWLDYLETHALRIYDALLRSDQAAARALGDHIKDLPSPFALRDVYRPCWTGLATREAAQEAVETLCDLGWLRVEQKKAGRSGGRPISVYHVNPAVRGVP